MHSPGMCDHVIQIIEQLGAVVTLQLGMSVLGPEVSLQLIFSCELVIAVVHRALQLGVSVLGPVVVHQVLLLCKPGITLFTLVLFLPADQVLGDMLLQRVFFKLNAFITLFFLWRQCQIEVRDLCGPSTKLFTP